MAAYWENFSFVVLFKKTIVARRKKQLLSKWIKINNAMSMEHKIRTVSYIKNSACNQHANYRSILYDILWNNLWHCSDTKKYCISCKKTRLRPVLHNLHFLLCAPNSGQWLASSNQISTIGSGSERVRLTTSSSEDLHFGIRPAWFTTALALIRADAIQAKLFVFRDFLLWKYLR